MKKLIIFLLFFNIMSSQNLVTREIFGNRNTKGWNTFIGGVSSTIPTSAQLATKLGISNNRIRNFVVVGSDIKCKIIGGYAMPSVCFYNDKNISYYNDIDNLVTKLNNDCFSLTDKILKIEFNGVVILGKSIQLNSKVEKIILPNCLSTEADLYSVDQTLKIFYIPKATNIGATVGNDNYFIGQSSFLKIYANPILQTVNSGGVEGDLVGRDVRYVTNFTPPNPVTSLATGAITTTSIQLNFTPPTGSTNAYDFSEIYKKDINGNWLYVSDIVSGGIVSGLTTGTTYYFKIVARDIFYNGSEEFITASTL